MEIQNHHKKAFVLLAVLVASLFVALQIHLLNSNMVASGNVGSLVGDIITSDTTWTTANSPYIITSTIQIPENVTLTIEPGVTVTAQSSIGTMFLINGFIQAHGNTTDRIIFDGNGDSNIFETNHLVNMGSLDLDYCILKNGRSAFWFDNTGSFNLTNSELSNLSQESYLWYPSQDVFIEFNTFTNTSGIKIGTGDYFSNSSGSVYIKSNLFINNQGYIINNFASYTLSKTYVNNNSFAGASGEILVVEKNSTTADMDASQNYWGTTDTSIIDSMISDKNDDPSCSSYINYSPILDASNPEVPVAPTATPTPSPTPIPTDTPTPDPSQSPAPSSISESSPAPSLSPEPSISPTQSPAPTNTPATIQSPNNSPNPISTTNPANPYTDPTANPNAAAVETDPSATPIIPEFSPLIALLILIVASSVGAAALRRKNTPKYSHRSLSGINFQEQTLKRYVFQVSI